MLDLWDETWFVGPPQGFAENKRRLIERSLKTWNDEKTILWGGGSAREAAASRVDYNDSKNGMIVTCCGP